MQQPEERPPEPRPTGGECYCPICGAPHWVPMGRMGWRHKMRMGMGPMGPMAAGAWLLSTTPLVLGFIAGYLVGSTRSR